MFRQIANKTRKIFQPTPDEIAAKAKLKLLKSLLLPRSDLDRDTKTSIRLADTSGRVWRMLIQNNRNVAFHDIMASGILPTSAEFAEVNAYNRNAWFYLSLDETRSPNRAALFLELLAMNILPRSEDLFGVNGSTNTCTWANLTVYKSQLRIFNRLLDLKIRPTQAGLNDLLIAYGWSLWWNILCHGEEGRKLVLRLIDMNIWPTTEELSEVIHESCAWNELFRRRVNHPIIYKLFVKNIFPPSETLSRKYFNKYSSWHWIFGITNSETFANALFAKQIFPTIEAVNIQDKEDNSTPWYWMLTKAHISSIHALLDNNLLPASSALSLVHQKSKLTPWLLLATEPHLQPIFTRLLDNNLVPSNEDLNFTQQNRSCWHGLAVTLESRVIFHRLLDLGRLPSKNTLEMVSDNEGVNLCYLLSTKCQGAEILDRLVALRVLPSARALSAIKNKDSVYNTWKNLLIGCDNHCDYVAENLIDHGVLPLTDKLLCDNEKYNEVELAKDKVARVQFRNLAYREAMMAFLLLRYALHDGQSTLQALNRDVIYLIIKLCFKDVIKPGYPTTRFFKLGHQLYLQHCEQVANKISDAPLVKTM
jgi:hypothetical protein